LKILSIPIDMPYPAFTGGRIDVWRRLCNLREDGAEIALLTWFDAERDQSPAPEVRKSISAVVSAMQLGVVSRSPLNLLRRLLYTGRVPSHAASRWLSIDKAAVLKWAQRFGPDVVLLDGLYGAQVAIWLAKALGVPLVYRAHNIEHIYMAKQLQLAQGWKSRLGLRANLVGLQRFERMVIDQAAGVLDISLDDMAWWQAKGVKNTEWLPTTVDRSFAAQLGHSVVKDIDILYFGNLNTPNNVDAVTGLLADVLPRLKHPGARVCLAGSRPNDAVRALVAKTPGATLIDSPADMAAVINRAKVLVNPVREGSGVNLKSVEMIFSDSALVSTTMGIQGLPADAKACFAVADGAEQIAVALDEALSRQLPDLAQRMLVRPKFSGADTLKQLSRMVQRDTVAATGAHQ
jgi:glycosyltransferase involved in cell wall biosynthesis